MTRNLLLLSALIFITEISFTQIHNLFHLDIEVGMNIGAPMTNIFDIPEGAKGMPGIGIHPGITLEYPQNHDFSVGVGVGYSRKGGSFTSPVAGKYDVTRGIFGTNFPIPLRVKYTGIVDGIFENDYVDFPFFVNYHRNLWKFRLGYQFSKLLNARLDGEVDVRALLLNFNDVKYDESDNIKSKDHALIIGAERQLVGRLSIAANFTYGLVKIMKKELEEGTNPRNVWVYLMVKYRLF